MKNWFTTEKIDSDTYCISEYRHWEQTHSWLLIGNSRALLIDTGLGVGNIGAEVKKLTKLPVTAVLTHAHWDHIGGLGYFPDFAMHEAEKTWLTDKFPLSEETVKRNLCKGAQDFPENFDAEQYKIFRGVPARILRDGETLSLGGREISVLHTPGHSPGHLCFYESERKYLFSGDLIYGGCLDVFYPTTDPAAFLSSVERIAELDIGKILPGHYSLNISPRLAGKVGEALRELSEKGLLCFGSGLFSFDGFSVRL